MSIILAIPLADAATLIWDDPVTNRTYIVKQYDFDGNVTIVNTTEKRFETPDPPNGYTFIIQAVGQDEGKSQLATFLFKFGPSEPNSISVQNVRVEGVPIEENVPPPPGARSLLVLLDETYAAPHAVTIQRWRNQVHREGRFAVSILEAMRVDRWDSPNRLVVVASDFKFVQQIKPSAVLVMGNVGMMASDNVNVDGHGNKTVWSWLHLAGLVTNWSQYTDIKAFPIYGASWITNGPGDGRFDTYRPNPSAKHQRIPFAINFGNQFTSPTQAYTTNVWRTNFYTSKLVFPEADEHVLFERYLQANLAYRQGKRNYTRTNLVQGSLWNERGISWGFPPGLPFVADISRQTGYGYRRVAQPPFLLAGAHVSWLYWNSEPFHYPYLSDPLGNVAACVVMVQYKSGGPYMAGAWAKDFLRHPLPPNPGPIALAAVWAGSSPVWMPYGPTVLDSAERSLRDTQNQLGITHQWYGDPTLPLPHALSQQHTTTKAEIHSIDDPETVPIMGEPIDPDGADPNKAMMHGGSVYTIYSLYGKWKRVGTNMGRSGPIVKWLFEIPQGDTDPPTQFNWSTTKPQSPP